MRARKWRGNEKKMRFLDTDLDIQNLPPFSFSFSSLSFSFSPNFPSVFSFFATKKINGEREYVKSAYFPAPSSCERFMRCMGASARFSAPLSRARSPVNARAWRGQGSDDVSRSRAKLVLCLGSQILNFHSRAFLKLFFFSPKYENKNNKIRG